MYQQVCDLEFGSHLLAVAVRRALKTGAAAAVLSVVSAPWVDVVQAQVAAPQQQGAPAARRSIEEVLVTARRREESAQTVPIAINAFDAGTLEDFHIENLEDLRTVVPSLTVSSSSGRPNSPVYSLRGVRPTEALYGQDPTVAIYFADVVLSPAKGSNLGMYDLASVQVLKGPQGTLFGRNTTGGAILLTPQRPGDNVGGDVMVGYGNFGLNETQLGIDLPVADNFAIRFSGRSMDRDGYQTNVAAGPLNGDKLGGGTQRSGRLSAVWDMTDSIENYTVMTWDDINMDGRAPVLEAVNPVILAGYQPLISDSLDRARNRNVRDIESDLRQTSEVDVWGVFNTTTFDIGGDLTVKSILGYRDMDAYEVIDLDATAIPNLLSSDQTTTLKHASYELQLLGKAFDDKLDWVTGLYWYYEDGVEDSPGTAFGNRVLQTADMTNKSYSVFGQGTFQFTSAWSMTAGLRWTYDDKEMTISNRTLTVCTMFDESGVRLPLDQCSLELSESFDQPTGTVSVEYAPVDGMLFYAASRLGYRAGGFNARASRFAERQPFDPETVTDLELGSKIDWFVAGWEMRSNVAVYKQWYDDIQRTVGVSNDGLPGSTIQNAAKAEIFGIELEQTIAPTENLSFTINYTYTDPEYRDWEDPLTGADLTDTPFHFTPEHAASLTAAYTYSLSGNAGLLRFTASAAYQDDVWINALQTSADMALIPESVHDTMQQDAYWTYDMGVSWNEVMGSALDVSTYIKNLTDEEYTVGGIQLYHRVGLNTKVYGEPRTYGVQLRYRF